MDRHLSRRPPADAPGTFVFLTDSAVGAQEEDNLRHLVTNLGQDVPRDRIVPFLTAKHSLEYCLSYADRAHQSGFPALVVLGGDKSCRRSALGRARLAAARDAARARSDACRSADGRIRTPIPSGRWIISRPRLQRRVLSDADREPSPDCVRFAFHRSGRAARSDTAGTLRRVLLPQRQSADAGRAQQLSAGSDRGLAREFAEGRPPKTSARERSAR